MIDSNESMMYEDGYDSGYYNGYKDCKEEMEEIIDSMAYEIFTHRNPKSYSCPEEEKLSIMKEFGWNEMCN